MPRCVVPFCKSDSRTSKISFHQIPSDYTLRAKWINAIPIKERRKGCTWIPTQYTVLCGNHFTSDDFKTGIKTKCLKPFVVPSVFPKHQYLKKEHLFNAGPTNNNLDKLQQNFEWSTECMRPAESPALKMSICAMALCKTRVTSLKQGIILHRFPSEKCLVDKWIALCKQNIKIRPRNMRVCSEHFSEDCYVRDLQNELLGLPVPRRLKEDALPNKNLPESNSKRIEQKTVHDTTKPLIVKLNIVPHKNVLHKIVSQDTECVDRHTLLDSSKSNIVPHKIVLHKITAEDTEYMDVQTLSDSHTDTSRFQNKNLLHVIKIQKTCIQNLKQKLDVTRKKLNIVNTNMSALQTRLKSKERQWIKQKCSLLLYQKKLREMIKLI